MSSAMFVRLDIQNLFNIELETLSKSVFKDSQ